MSEIAPPVIVDDHLLLRLLVDDEPESLRPMGGAIFTTGLWYHRLCRSLARPRAQGALTRRLEGHSATSVAHALRAATALPEHVELLSLRLLAPPMAALLAEGHRQNLLALEALAAALHVGGVICVAERNLGPNLSASAEVLGIEVRQLAA